MKKFLLAAILAVLSTSCATAQYSSDYYDDNDYDYTVNVDDDLLLTDRQWHTDDVSILEANNYQYLVLRGGERYRCTLGRLNAVAYQNLWGETIVEYRPYYYNGSLGWFVVGSLLNYFIYPDGRWCRFSYRPTYYSYHYPVYHSRCLNLFHWHFWTGRHHHHYHGHCYAPPRRRAPVHYRNDRRSYGSRSSGVKSRSDGYRNSRRSVETRQTSGRSTVRNSNASRRSSGTVSNGSVKITRPNSGSERSSRSSSYSGTSRTNSGRSYQSSGSGHSRSSVSGRSSSSRSSSVSTRTSSGSSSRSSAARSSGGSSRRR